MIIEPDQLMQQALTLNFSQFLHYIEKNVKVDLSFEQTLSKTTWIQSVVRASKLLVNYRILSNSKSSYYQI